jgi:AbrB family looped-hinge helix DNA binding protein
MFRSRITSKGQVTIPKPVREALELESGDAIVYEIKGNTVTVRKARPFDAEWHDALATQLDEWNSPANDEAWNDL